MSETEVKVDVEFAAMESVYKVLKPLEADSRQRVFEYIAARLEISAVRGKQSSSLVGSEENEEQLELEEGSTPQHEFATLAELHDTANPRSIKERVLVAAYWLQVIEGADSFVSYSVNQALKDLGHGVSNMTGAFDALKRQTPALVLQLKKAGKSRQARKTYKLTKAGIVAVEEMIDG